MGIQSKYRDHILQELRRDHPGCSRMKCFARSYVWWPGIDKDIENVAKAYISYQSHKHTWVGSGWLDFVLETPTGELVPVGVFSRMGMSLSSSGSEGRSIHCKFNYNKNKY